MAKELNKIWHSADGNTLTASLSKQDKMRPVNLVQIKRWVALIFGILLFGTWLVLSAVHNFLFWEEAILSLGVVLCILLFRTVKQYNDYDSKIKF